ncbi:MAG: ferritin [Candidatus Sumerlaeia bacterium]
MSKLSAEVEKELNAQIRRELMSAYIYYGLAAYFEGLNYPGIAAWFMASARDEISHGLKFSRYIFDRGGRLALDALDKPPVNYESPVAAFEAALEREKDITDSINTLYALALKKNDYATQVFLQDMIEEQVEEIKEATEQLSRIKACQESAAAMIMLDRELARRAAGQN